MQTQLRIGQPKGLYAFIEAHREEFDVRTMCQVLGVSRSSFYDWLQNPISARARENERLLRLIRASFRASHGVYGARRVFLDLREAGETCSKHRVARLMRLHQIRAQHGYRRPRYIPSREAPPIPNILKRDFAVSKPNSVWVTDITYIRIYKNREIATADISEYIEQFYNPVRRHTYLGGVSPDVFEAASRTSKKCPV